MTLDGLTLHYIVEEIKEQIVGSKVDKIYQPQPDTVILSLRAPGSHARLLICAGAFDSRMHLTAQKYQNPKAPPMFCMFLRKYITGARIARIAQVGLERIVNITLEAKDELGLTRGLTLVAEMMGKYSNVILKDDNDIIMDSLRHVTRSQSRVRCVLPSLAYALPPSVKLNPLTVSKATLIEMLGKRGKSAMRTYLSHFLQGISGQTADEILYRYAPAGYTPQIKEAENIADVLTAFLSDLKQPQPTVYLQKDGTPYLFSPIVYHGVSAGRMEHYGSMNEMVDGYYFSLRTIGLFNKKREALAKVVSKQIEKLSFLLQKQQETVEKAKKAESFKNTGDVITANIYRISKGMRTLDAQDFSTGQAVEIALDPRLSPAANAQKYYRKYNKYKAGLDITLKRMRANSEEIAFLESVQASLDSCETMAELMEIEYELVKAGVMRPAAAGAKATEKPSEPHKFISSDGYTILAGKNNRQNDMLTMKTAADDDIWLHTKNIPGSHVLITGAKGRAPDGTLAEAASIAAYLSKAKGSYKVAVDYTQRKNIRKPNAARPGMVVYEGYNTILANPDPALFERLLIK